MSSDNHKFCEHRSHLTLEGDDLLPDETQDLTITTEEIQSPAEERPVIQPQPAVIATRINERDVVRTTDIRVSERTPLSDLRLKPFDPIYNELTGEVRAHIHYIIVCYPVFLPSIHKVCWPS